MDSEVLDQMRDVTPSTMTFWPIDPDQATLGRGDIKRMWMSDILRRSGQGLIAPVLTEAEWDEISEDSIEWGLTPINGVLGSCVVRGQDIVMWLDAPESIGFISELIDCNYFSIHFWWEDEDWETTERHRLTRRDKRLLRESLQYIGEPIPDWWID